MKSITIAIKILDYWLVDNYKLGHNSIVYMLIQIGDRLSLKEMEIQNEKI